MSISDEALIKWSADIRRFLDNAREAYLERKAEIEKEPTSFENLLKLGQLCKFYKTQEEYLGTVATAFDYVVNGHVVTDVKQVYDKTMRKAGDVEGYLDHMKSLSPIAHLSGTLDTLRDSLTRKDAVKNN